MSGALKPGQGAPAAAPARAAGTGMDSARRKEEIKNRDKGHDLLKEAQKCVRSAIRHYHKDWSVVFMKFTQAQQKLTQARDHFSKAGLLADTLLGLTAGGRRIHAREVMGLMEDESLHYLLEPRLPDEVVIDYLDRKVPTHQATPQR